MVADSRVLVQQAKQRDYFLGPSATVAAGSQAHVKLNDPGTSNGVQEFWIDEQLEAVSDNLNFVASYTDYAINAIFFENYWNSGSPQLQERYFDNIVVSTQPIGPYQ